MSITVLATLFSAALGAIAGNLLSLFITDLQRKRQSHRIVGALSRELEEVSKDIQLKMIWLRRNVRGVSMTEVDPDRIVQVGEAQLYLGEREEFTVARPYWQSKYTDAVDAIDKDDFEFFYVGYRRVDRFEQKFKDLKLTFDTNLGKKAGMATMIYRDLEKINEELRKVLEERLGRSIKVPDPEFGVPSKQQGCTSSD